MNVREVPSILTFLKREKIPYHSYRNLHNKVEGIKYMLYTSKSLQHQLDHKAKRLMTTLCPTCKFITFSFKILGRKHFNNPSYLMGNKDCSKYKQPINSIHQELECLNHFINHCVITNLYTSLVETSETLDSLHFLYKMDFTSITNQLYLYHDNI